jgi:GDP-4-dehydro-6-deoxy-D-mannose reductase
LKILLTGIAGFVGRHLALSLRDLGHEVCGTDLPGQIPVPGFEVKELDLSREDPSPMLREIRPDAVVHLAAQSSPARSLKDPRATFESNVTGTHRLLEAMRESCPDTRLLFVGSADVYGSSDSAHSEDDPLEPGNPYGASKAAGEMLVLQYARTWSLPWFATRSFPHSGPGQSTDFVLPAFAKQIAEAEAGLREPRILVGNLQARRDWLDLRDVLCAYELLLEKGQPGEVYNVCSGQAHSVREALDYFVSRSKLPLEIVEDPSRLRPVDLPLLLGDYSRLQEATGWTPQFSFSEMLERVLSYWKEHAVKEKTK